MKMNSSSLRGIIAINLTALTVGSSALFGKLDVAAIWIVAVRVALAMLVLLPLAIARKELKKPTRADAPYLLGTGVILALHWVLFFLAVKLAGVAVATLTFATFPMFTVVMEAIRDKKWPTAIRMAASAGIVLAVYLLVHMGGDAGNLTLGALAGLGSALTYAVFWIMSKAIGACLPALSISIYQYGAVLMALLPFLPFSAPLPVPGDWAWLTVLGVVITALSHQLYFYSLKYLSASTCSGFIALEPVYAIILAALFFQEPLTYTFAISAALIVGASFLLHKKDGKILVE